MTDTLEEARNIEAKVKSDNLAGEFFKHQRTLKMKDLWPQYEEWAKTNKASWKDDRQRYHAHIDPVIGPMTLNKTTPVDVEKTLDRMRAATNRNGRPYQPQTVKHVFNLIRRLINFAKRRAIYGGENPCDKITLPTFDNTVTNPMNDHEQQRLMDVMESWPNKWAVRLIKFWLFTGRRRGEVKKLQWQDVDMASRTVRFQGLTTKNAKTQIMPMNDLAYDVLEQAQRQRTSDYVFPCSTGKYNHSVDNTWKRIRAKAGLDHIRIHDIRHTFATNVVGNGQSLYHLQHLLGHKTGQMTQRYAHLRNEKLREAANSFSGIFDKYRTWKFEDILNLPEEERNALVQHMIEESEREPSHGEEPEGIDDMHEDNRPTE